MNAVLVSRVTDADSPLVRHCPKSYSLARPVLLEATGPLVSRDALKDLIDCEYLGSDVAMWDGLMVTIWYHDDDLDLCGEEVIEREVTCEVVSYGDRDVIGLLEGLLVITGPVTAEGVLALSGDTAQGICDRVNAGMPLRGPGDVAFTFTELLALGDPPEPGGDALAKGV